MKNKILNLLGVVMALMFFQSCYEDEGNYDYTELSAIEIEGIETSYVKRKLVDTLSIPVTINTEYNHDDLKYTWFIYDESKVNYIDAVPVDTISREKDLNYLVAAEPGNYVLTLRVENTDNQYAVYKSVSLQVTTQFSQGFYILKETADGNTDLDFCSTNMEMGPDIFANTKGGALKGKPEILSQMMDHPYIDPATSSRTYGHAIGITTSEDLCMLRTSDLATIHTGESMFYGGLESTPRRLARGYQSGLYFSEDGIYVMPVGKAGSGILGVPKWAGRNVKWVAYDNFHQMTSGFICFDENNGDFIFISTMSSSGSLATYKGDAAEYQPNGITDKCLFMGMSYFGDRLTVKNTAYAVFEATDGTKRLYKLRHAATSAPANPIQSVKVIDGSMKMSKATAFSVCAFDAPLMYFLADGKVYYYSFQDESEKEITLPGIGADETIYYVANKYWASLYANYSHNRDWLVVGTTTGNNDYKLYFYKISGGTPDGEPMYVMSGTGKVADVQYMYSSWYGNDEFKYQTYTSASYQKLGLCY